MKTGMSSTVIKNRANTQSPTSSKKTGVIVITKPRILSYFTSHFIVGQVKPF